MNTPQSLERGSLWRRTLERTEHAIRCGALHSIPTRQQRVPTPAGVDFVVRLVTNLQRKVEARQRQPHGAAKANPFLPYEQDMFVTDLSPTHLCLLNKFNVVDHHLLIVTRAFEEQLALLTRQDFEALWGCLQEFPSLGFYNAGEEAGASQRHKHLQVVPLSLSAEGPSIPVEGLLDGEASALAPGVEQLKALPFRHALCRLDPGGDAQRVWRLYQAQLEALGMTDLPSSQRIYNLLVTPSWMLLVPRSREHFETISVNALGFAGSLLARDEREMSMLIDTGPLEVLRRVATGS